MPRMFCAAVLTCTWASTAGAQSLDESDVPMSLLRAASAHADIIRTARLEVVQRMMDTNTQRESTRYFTWRCGGESIAQTIHGDEEGVVLKPGDGVLRAATFRPQHVLSAHGKVWTRFDLPTTAVLEDAGKESFHRVVDFRRVNLFASAIELEPLAALARCIKTGGAPRFAEAQEGELVRASFSSGDMTLDWTIDPGKNWSVIACEVVNMTGVLSRTLCDVVESDGVWFPKSISIQSRGMLTRFEFPHRSFNQPDHPSELTPADIGIEPGFRVEDRGANQTLIWSGMQLLPHAEFAQLVRAGRVRVGPTVARCEHMATTWMRRSENAPRLLAELNAALAGSGRGGGAFEVALTAWERYTAEFVEKHQLSAPQRDEALLVLKRSQDDARNHISRREAEYAAHQREADLAARDASPEGDQERARLAAKRQELLEPLDAIFESKLQRGLERLLTDAQRKAAASAAPASQPPGRKGGG